MTQTIAKLQLARPRLQIKAQLPAGAQGIQGVQGAQGVQGIAGPTGPGYGGTSTTSLLIANSTTKVFTTQAGLAYQVGNYVRASSAAGSANFMEGAVSAYSGTSLSIAVTNIGGAGTFADWNFGVAGTPGSVGVASIAGNAGAFTLGNALKNVVNEIDIDPSFLGPACFGGRLTLQSGVAVMSTDQLGSQNVWYAPFKSKSVPVYSAAGGWSLKQFTSGPTDQVGLVLALAGSANWPKDTLHDFFAVMDSGTLKIATRQWDAGMLPTSVQIANVTAITTGTGATAWTRASAAFNGTVSQNGAASATIAAPANTGIAQFLGQAWSTPQTVSSVVVTAPTDHYIFSQVGPTDLQLDGSNDGTNWVLLGRHYINDDTLGKSFTLTVNADNQVPYLFHRVGFDDTNAGNTFFVAQIQFFKTVAAAAGRRLTLHDGIWVNDAIIGSGTSPNVPMRTGAATTITTAQYEGVYLGTGHIDTATDGQISFASTYQALATCGIWNLYNQRKLVLKAGIRSTAKFYTLTSRVFTPCGNGTPFNLQVLSGLAFDPVTVKGARGMVNNAIAAPIGFELGIAVNQSSANNCWGLSGIDVSANLDATGQLVGTTALPLLTLAPYAGINNFTMIETVNSGGGICQSFNEAREGVLQYEGMY